MNFTNHKKYYFIGIILIALVGARLYLPIFAKNEINEILNKDPLYRGSVDDVGIHLWRCAYSLIGLDIRRVDGQKTFPLVAAEDIDIGLSWKELLKRTIVAKIVITDAKINIVDEKKQENGEEKKVVEVGGKSKATKKKELHTWQDTLNDLVPLKIGRLTVNNGEIHFRDLTSASKVNVFLDRMHVEASNLTNSSQVSESLFGTIELKARAMKTGKLHIHVYLDPLKVPFEGKLDLKLSDLDLTDLNSVFTAYGKFDVKKGKFGLYSEMATNKNKVEGYFKPIIQDLEVSDFAKDREKSLGHAIWEKIVGAAGGILKNYPKDRQAAKIPFSGNLDSPRIDVWATITSIFHNIFVGAITPEIDHTVKLKDVK